MTLQWLDPTQKMCKWQQSKAHAAPIPATHVLIFDGTDLRFLLACLPCAEYIKNYQAESLGVATTVYAFDDAPALPAPCRWMWRSHGCHRQGGHEGAHRCDCGDAPTERDELWQDE